MSSRQIRKIYGTTALPPLEGNSDEEFEPLYCKEKGASSKYGIFEVSSNSENENHANDEDNVDIAVCQPDKTKKKKKKKKKQRKAKEVDQDPENINHENMDDIDAAILEVKSMFNDLPTPSTNEVPTTVETEPNLQKVLFSVRAKHLNYEDEARRFYGPDEDDTKKRPRYTKYTRPVIIPIKETNRFVKMGVSMSLIKHEDGKSYFVYDHSYKYQIMHKSFLHMIESEGVYPLPEIEQDKHLERLYTFTNYLFKVEEYGTAKTVLEIIISNLQYCAHHTFMMTNQNHRLEYKYLENRLFHMAAMRHLLMLSNKAMHRTALEVCKLLLNLDPSDPLAVLFLIDTIALRAREYKWLIDAIEYWQKTQDIDHYFNLKFSYAFAHFHYARINKLDGAHADKLLKKAIFEHPVAAGKLFKAMLNRSDPIISNHYLFGPVFAKLYEVGDVLAVMMDFQALVMASRWREPAVYAWASQNVHDFLKEYDEDEALQERVRSYRASHHYGKYVNCPLALGRQGAVVLPMSKYLFEQELELPGGTTRVKAWDPYPPADGINRYNYGVEADQPRGDAARYSSIARDFVLSLSPDYSPEPPLDREDRDLN